MDVLTAFGAVALATAFLTSAVHKVRDLRGFREQLDETLRGPEPLSQAAVYGTPALEILAVVLLLSPYALAGFALALVLFAAFTAYLAVIIRSGSGASCGCAGRTPRPASRVHLYRNAVFMAVGLAGLVTAAAGQSAGFTHYALAAAPAIPFGFVLLHVDELTSFFRASSGPALRTK